MKSVAINGELRAAVGKKDAKALRAVSKVPCVLYGGKEPVHFQADFSEFRKIIYTPNVYLIDLEISGKSYKAIMQDIQWHPVHEEILHVDFLQIFDDKAVKIDVPVKVEGYAKGMREGGKLKINLRRLRVKALPTNIPDTIKININDLGLGQAIKVGQVNAENVEILNAKSNPVVTVVITRAARAAMNAAKSGK
ncbi:MAG: 50S ribosomal protein L25/general stress protein Ctc [Mangrovibacterium sp.]